MLTEDVFMAKKKAVKKKVASKTAKTPARKGCHGPNFLTGFFPLWMSEAAGKISKCVNEWGVEGSGAQENTGGVCRPCWVIDGVVHYTDMLTLSPGGNMGIR